MEEQRAERGTAVEFLTVEELIIELQDRCAYMALTYAVPEDATGDVVDTKVAYSGNRFATLGAVYLLIDHIKRRIRKSTKGA